MCHANHRREDYDRLVELLKTTGTQTPSMEHSHTNPLKGLVVAGTDTDAGKTLVSALLQNAFIQRGSRVPISSRFKPVIFAIAKPFKNFHRRTGYTPNRLCFIMSFLHPSTKLPKQKAGICRWPK